MQCIRDGVHQPYSYVVTPNVDHLALLQHNTSFRRAYAKARWRVCDSRVLMPMLHSLGVRVPEVIPGSDLTLDLLAWADRKGLRLVLIGSTEQECLRLQARYPDIRLFHHNPPMGFIDQPEEVERCLQFIREHPSELVFYAVGAPRQEILASAVSSTDRTGMGFCIGASIAFATGSVKRAPVWMQQARLEWLHRMLSEPKRLAKRYFQDLMFIIPAYIRARNQRNNRCNPAKQDS
ncbi:WecB/TagA/CpsF family glycosyltransferase [Stutzerimonas tarimensis]|uniref:WecB/TagA/CpsF family glycosyltransferase n=1 Tax=Stutzerimonas tarimensis TaxID=1507735 RepID=A0ABV7T437_9GAMM